MLTVVLAILLDQKLHQQLQLNLFHPSNQQLQPNLRFQLNLFHPSSLGALVIPVVLAILEALRLQLIPQIQLNLFGPSNLRFQPSLFDPSFLEGLAILEGPVNPGIL
jgi:hypothetical protein